MKIDYENTRTINIQKQWDGITDDKVTFTINGGWNDFDGHYVDSVELDGYDGDDYDSIIENITEEFLNEMNG
jgi:hypothetical protein